MSAAKREYRDIATEQLQESATNPRRRFNQKSLQELAATFKTQGILQPLVVRELEPNKHEIVAGARRFRAAKIAELKTVPVRVVKLSDAAAIEAQAVENVQREDVHALEEGFSYRSLLELKSPIYTIQTIAAKVGKSAGYIQGRITLTELVPTIAEAFLEDRISIGHALLIARLPQSRQQDAFTAAFRQMWVGSANTQVLMPVRELASWIEANILLELEAAPFSKDDAALLPDAGSCVNCHKRTGFNALLFPEVRKDSCLDGECFRAKIEGHIARTIEKKPALVQISNAWSNRQGSPLGRSRYVELELKKSKSLSATAKLSPAQKPCEKMREAIVMDGGSRGHIVKVCADANCRIHYAKQPAPEVGRVRAEERQRIEKDKLEITARHRILTEVLKRVGAPLKRADLLAVVRVVLMNLPHMQEMRLAKRHKVDAGDDGAKPQLLKQISTYDETALSKLLVEMSLLDSAYQCPAKDAEDSLISTARRYRVDTDKVQKTVAQEFASKKKAKQSNPPNSTRKTA